jgi:hypothetical protein
MNKFSKIYYSFLAALVVAQLCHTAFGLSQNIGFGQKIAILENRKQQLLLKQTQLEQQLAKEVALYRLSAQDNQSFRAIDRVTTVQISSNNLAALR